MAVITGKVNYQRWRQDPALHIGDAALAEVMECFGQQQVCAAYAFSPEPITGERLLEMAITQADGLIDATLFDRYSEITGYLYTVEEASIGGHDMLAIFHEHQDEYGCLVLKETPIDLEGIAVCWEDEIAEGEQYRDCR